MNVIALGDEGVIRLSIFLSLFVLFAVTERLAPRRRWRIGWARRWVHNISLSVVNTLCVRLLVPFSGTAFAIFIAESELAILDSSRLPFPLAIILFVLIFDVTIYFQHRLFHHFDWLWRLHRVHHTDLDYDVTTGSRFHPVSILISLAIKFCLVWLFGALPLAILIAEVLLNATSMFNHSNLRLPRRVDRVVRWVMVTPDMHRIHHSTNLDEHSHNFGFNFSVWDRLFGTYLDSAELPQEDMDIGIKGFEEESAVRLDHLLLQPMNTPKSS